MMALAAGLPTIFRDREDVRPEGETSLGMRQVLAAPTTSRLRGPPSGGPVTHNGEGPLRITEGPASALPPRCELARSRPALEVADILRDHGAAWRSANGALLIPALVLI